MSDPDLLSIDDGKAMRGVPTSRLALKFLRVVPLVHPKRTLTGEAAEPIVTRVGQVIHEIGLGPNAVPSGMVVDAFVEAGEPKSAAPIG